MTGRSRRERGLHELYADDPERADRQVFGRTAHADRRGFLRGAGLAALGAALGLGVPFHRSMPAGLIPAAFAATGKPFAIVGKDGLLVLNDRPLNAETPAHLLDDEVTPTGRHFVRNNGTPPAATGPEGWTLTVDGAVGQPLALSVEELKSRFETVSLRLQLECGGNGRAGLNPPPRGLQWSLGAVGNSEWTGVRLRDVLEAAGLKDGAVYTGHYGADAPLSRNAAKEAISRGLPLAKAMEPHTLIAFAQNGAPIHPMNGAPLRIVAPGFPGSASQKWLTRIQVREQVHDGAKMGGEFHRMPANPVAPGDPSPQAAGRIIEAMPVKSLITSPETGRALPPGARSVEVRGNAWVGEGEVRSVQVSQDFGATWLEAALAPAPNPFSWRRWRVELSFPGQGYYEIWARATDDRGRAQPHAGAWNPRGYLNNAMHRIALMVTA